MRRLNTYSDSYTVSVFPSPSTDLSVGVQTAARTPLIFVFSGINYRNDLCERKDTGRKSDIGARRYFESTGRNNDRKMWSLYSMDEM